MGAPPLDLPGGWHWAPDGTLTTADGGDWQLRPGTCALAGRVLLRVRSPAGQGLGRSLVVRRPDLPPDQFRHLKARLRLAGVGQGNFPAGGASEPPAHVARGGVDGGPGIAIPHDR